MKFKELEFKYKADKVPLSQFMQFCNSTNKGFTASGYDYFYESKDDSTSFCRHRVGPDLNQLTFKKKTTDKNNYLRDEDNITLSGVTSREQMDSICAKFGYIYAGAIFKNCFIYEYDRHTFVYYVCYDKDMVELGRFIEIEMSESYPWLSDQQAMNELLDLEQRLARFNILPQSRVRRSLFEMYIQGAKNSD